MKRAVCVGLLLMILGCQPIQYEKTFAKTAAFEVLKIELDPPTYNQRVSVTVTPSAGGVSAYLVKASDMEHLENILVTEKEKKTDLGPLLLGSNKTEGANAITFEGTVPAKSGWAILVKNGPTVNDITIKFVGR
jgi:hypothetical protein